APSPNCSIPFQRGRVCVTARNVTHGVDAPVFDGQVSLACGTVAELTTRIGAPFPQQAAGFELKGIVASTGNERRREREGCGGKGQGHGISAVDLNRFCLVRRCTEKNERGSE